MSNFRAMTRATESGLKSGVDERFKDWQPASWFDNYFGGHKYGIKFDDDPIVRTDNGDFIYNPEMPVPELSSKEKEQS